MRTGEDASRSECRGVVKSFEAVVVVEKVGL